LAHFSPVLVSCSMKNLASLVLMMTNVSQTRRHTRVVKKRRGTATRGWLGMNKMPPLSVFPGLSKSV
jgi:hypothetical protein